MSPLAKYCVRSHRARPFTSLLIILSLSLVAFTIGAVGAVGFGLAAMFHDTGSPKRAIVLANGTKHDLFSKLSVEDIDKVAVVPKVVRSSPENAFILDSRMPDGTLETVRMVGLEDSGFAMHDVTVLEGRRPAPGALEFMVGKLLLTHNPALAIGNTVKADRYAFTCVGVFHADPMLEAALVTTRAALTVDRGNPWLSDIVIEAATESDARDAAKQMNTMRTLDVNAHPEPGYYRDLLEDYRDLYVLLVGILTLVLLGGALAAAATLTVLQNRRIPDMGALRVVGFRPRTLTLMLLSEIQLISLLAAVIGGGAAWLVFRGFIAHAGFGYAPISFTAEVTPTILGAIVVAMAVIGLVSSLLPLQRLRRIDVIGVLRA